MEPESEKSSPSGFNYSDKERIIMAIINTGSNLGAIPIIMLLIKRRDDFEIFLAFLTLIASLMYHFCDGLDINLYMTELEWHLLDNIGSICSVCCLMIAVSNMSEKLKHKLRFLVLLVVILMQFSDPWNIVNTIIPPVIFLLIFIYTRYNDFSMKIKTENKRKIKNLYIKGIIVLPIAFFCFVFGLDEDKDYMRIHHSLWHILVSYSTYYIRLAGEKEMISRQIDKFKINEEEENYFSMFFQNKNLSHITNYLNDI